MTRSLLAAAGLLLAAAPAPAQVDAEIALERDTLLLYEPVRVLVQLTNFSTQPLDPAKAAGEKPWLEVFVTRSDDTAVPRTSKPWAPASALLLPGQKRTLATDILPLFQVREPGSYRIHVRVNSGGRPVAARTLKLSVDRGTPLWQQQVSLPPDPEDHPPRPRARLYSLLVHRGGEARDLYARVQDPQEERVFGTSRLGPWVNSTDLDARIDRDGVLHVLQRAGARIFRYSRVTAQGRVLPQRVFSNMASAPRLAVLGNESVDIVGGEEIVLDEKKDKVEGMIPTAPLGEPPRRRAAPEGAGGGF